MRYFLELSYNGTPFLGWQIQPEGPTVQGTIEAAMRRLLGREVGITGAGRTDTGVHARQMFAHFDVDEPLREGFLYSLNCMVGKDIAIHNVKQVADDAHARFDAVRRTYRYYVTTRKNPFFYPLSWKAPETLDFGAMNRAAELLLGRRDFTSFSKLHTQVKTNICTISKARWVQQEDGFWYFEVSADRFLRNMVRAIVGTLVEVGRGKLAPAAIADIIAAQNRAQAGTSMPPQALFLWQIDYSNTRTLDHSTTRPIDQSTNRIIDHSTNRPIDHSIDRFYSFSK